MKESQEKMFPHSEVKVKLLKLYLEKYISILQLSPYVNDVYIYDLFCGEGIYPDGGKGSPIIITETIKNIYYGIKAIGKGTGSIHCHFNDIEETKTNKVQYEIQARKLHYPEIGNLSFSNIDYVKLVPEINARVKGLQKGKAFVFIDPYGYRDIKVADIKTLLSSGKSEVLLFLPTQFMFRFEKKGTPESLIEFISELMPPEKWPQSETGIDFIENLTDAFRGAIGVEYFVDSFIITRDKNQFFCLFFFTNHILGFDKMLESKWEIDKEDGRGWSYEGGQGLFAEMRAPNTIKFEKKLIDFLKIKTRSNSEVYEFTLRNGHLPKHANDILINFQENGQLQVADFSGETSRKNAFYLNYKAYRDEPTKVYIKYR